MFLRWMLCSLLGLFLTFQFACKSVETKVGDGVVISEKADVLNSTALVSTKLAQLKKGDKLEILSQITINGVDYTKIVFTLPGSKKNQIGWIETRHIVSKKLLDSCEELSQSHTNIPDQAQARLKQQSNLRISPSRDSEIIATLKGGTTFNIIKRKRVEYKPVIPSKGQELFQSQEQNLARIDDWYLVRFSKDSVYSAGWIYGGALEIIAPEPLPGLIGPGRQVAAYIPIGQVQDSDGASQTNYVVLDKQNFNRDELIDFDRIYVVAWDSNINGYGSVYIESNLRGVYPVMYTKDGDKVEFSLLFLDKSDKSVSAKYEAAINVQDGKLHVAKSSDSFHRNNHGR